jgi:hypothetical protein
MRRASVLLVLLLVPRTSEASWLGWLLGTAREDKPDPIHAAPARPLLGLDDLIVVFPSSSNRIELVVSSRSWRKGIRTFIATNATAEEAARLTAEHAEHLETYAHHPDEPMVLGQKPCEQLCRARTQ